MPASNQRWLAIDHGTRRIGIAMGNASDAIASPLEVIPASPQHAAIAKILQVANEYQATGIVVGWPLNMDGTEGPQGKLAREMARQLAEATGLDVRLWDERLTSFAADEVLRGQFTRKKKKARQDAFAAAAILGDFFRGNGPATAPRPGQVAE